MRLPKRKTKGKRPLRRITAEWLVNNSACVDEVDQFNKTFPEGAEITLDNLLRALNAEISVVWLVYPLMHRGFISYQRKRRLLNRYHNLVLEWNRESAGIRNKHFGHNPALLEHLTKMAKDRFILKAAEMLARFFDKLGFLVKKEEK